MADSKDWIVRYYANHDDIPEGLSDGHIVRELIKCKECKHFLKARNEDEYDSCSILFEMQDVPLETDEDKYCAWAERKE